MTYPITIIGHEGSPYSRKLRALCRYRHIPFRWVADMGPEYQNPPPLRVKLLPIVVTHNEQGEMLESATDSTPLIRRFEKEYAGRSVLPPDSALCFLNSLVEDYADEWCTKIMFHYRWWRQEDIDWAGEYLVQYINPALPKATSKQMAEAFRKRQIDRLWVVGSNDQTAPIIENAYVRVLDLLDDMLESRMFLFGDRPSSADFALFGQLCQMCEFDPTPMAIARERAPRVVAWCRRVEELSGWLATEEQWLDRDTAFAKLAPLLSEIGQTYARFLLANADALQKGEEEVHCEIDGIAWSQKTFPYQGKCLKALREQFAALADTDQAWLREKMSVVHCEQLL